MTPRERCLRAILNEVPDRVPLVFRARPEVVSSLMSSLGLHSYEDLLGRLHVDVREAPGIALTGGYLEEGAELKEGPYGPAYTKGYVHGFEVRKDIWGVESIWAPDHTYTYTFLDHPLRRVPLDDYRWPEVVEDSYDDVERFCRMHGERFLIYGGVIHLFEIAWQLTGFNDFMRLLYREPATVNRILDGLDEIRFRQAELLVDAGVDVVYDGDDVGAQTTMIISPSTWRRYLKPRYKKLADLCHRRGAFFFFHSDGWIEPIIGDLVEIGVDILNPVQPECMDVAKVKEMCRGEVCLEGTISVQRTLPFGSPGDVAREVASRVEKLGPSGLILGPTHAIQPDTPLENILALYDTAVRVGVFRGR